MKNDKVLCDNYDFETTADDDKFLQVVQAKDVS